MNLKVKTNTRNNLNILVNCPKIKNVVRKKGQKEKTNKVTEIHDKKVGGDTFTWDLASFSEKRVYVPCISF